MRKIRKVMVLIIVFVIAVSIKGNTAFAEYVIQIKPGTSAWTEISVSAAYDECQKLNQTSSTLGTTSLKAHLTTNADWYAVSLLTYSAYGARSANNTTGNSTGIMNFGSTWTFTSSVMEGSSSNDNRKSLYDNIDTPYVESVKNATNRASNEPGRGLLSNEMISTSYGGANYSNAGNYPVCVHTNLFGFYLGYGTETWGIYGAGCAGNANVRTTFRPVIWNK